MKLGHYLERGGKGQICQSSYQQSEMGQYLTHTYKPLWKKISLIAKAYDFDYYQILKQIPKQFRTLGIFSFFVCNLKPPPKVHRDSKDFKWCFIFLFGDFVKSGTYLYYLNLYVNLQLGDILMLKSYKIWHNADTDFQGLSRYSGILTTHNGLLQRFLNKM
jgi:hypothetical protein